jgi:ribosomal protein S6E (S10)
VPLRRPLREHELNLTRKDLDVLAPGAGTRVELEIASERYFAVTARTFGDARDGEIILYEDAYENIAIAISGGSAAGTFFSAQPASRSDSRRRLMLEQLGRKFARFTTDQVVRRPRLWPLFRGDAAVQFNRIAPAWDQRRTPKRSRRSRPHWTRSS